MSGPVKKKTLCSQIRMFYLLNNGFCSQTVLMQFINQEILKSIGKVLMLRVATVKQMRFCCLVHNSFLDHNRTHLIKEFRQNNLDFLNVDGH